MRRLILEEWLSLDGYAVDKEGTLDFFPSTEADRFSDRDQLEFLESVDTILLGRRTYELFVDFWPTATTDTEIIADRLNSLPKLVFSNTLRRVAPGASRPRRRRCRDRAPEGTRWEALGPVGEPLPSPEAHRSRPHRRVSLPALSDGGRGRAIVVPNA